MTEAYSGIESFRSSQQTCSTFSGEWLQRADGDIDCRLSASADCAAEKIQQRSFGFMNDVGRDVLDSTGYDVRGQRFGFRQSFPPVAWRLYSKARRCSGGL
jgi:hypothetical protein